MISKKILPATLCLVAVAAAFAPTRALADVITYGPAPGIAVPQVGSVIVAPGAVIHGPMIRTERRIAPIFTQQVITQPAVVMPQVMRTETVVTQERTQPALISTTTIAQLDKIENFRHRLDAVLDQISLGEQKGLMAPATAQALRNTYNELSSAESSIRVRGTMTADENNWLESQINLLNQRVANSMVH